MKKWRIRREKENGQEWFYPEGRFLWFWYRGFYRVIEPCVAIRFKSEGDAILWIQNVMQEEKNRKAATYSYPFEGS